MTKKIYLALAVLCGLSNTAVWADCKGLSESECKGASAARQAHMVCKEGPEHVDKGFTGASCSWVGDACQAVCSTGGELSDTVVSEEE